MQKILHNRLKCRKCGDIIESRHVHDFVQCKCGSVFVDGGHEYLRWGGNPDDYEDMSEVEEWADIDYRRIADGIRQANLLTAKGVLDEAMSLGNIDSDTFDRAVSALIFAMDNFDQYVKWLKR